MARPPEERFNCPQCGASYAVIRVEAPRGDDDEAVKCVNCSAPFQAREDAFALKYFLVGPTPPRTRGRRGTGMP
jgi:predicted Zn finger-like uncharacterized protein